MVVEQLDIVKAYNENRELFTLLIREGWIDPVRIRNMEIFLEYNQLEKKCPAKMKRKYMIAIRRNISTKTVERAINSFD